MDPWGTPHLRLPFLEIAFFIITCCLAHIIPLFKSGDKSSMSNYRPVALLSTISKVFEKVVYKHIFNFLMENALKY
jgi:hypothetical protein